MRIKVHAPQQQGTYHEQFSWLVTINGVVAYSGSRSGARSYARRMKARA
jgi:hypothetical protein